ncbi:MAG: LrgB family protein [Eubacterium sp.]|nr:LrgB family protein [Eubacterium sp.]MCM1411183.1 LrgB family protein [Lachnospiraceae bacterium]
MSEYITESVYFGVILSITAYLLGSYIKKKTKIALLNPLLLSILFCILVLSVGGIPYEAYNSSASYISYLLTPATICLAIPLYRQFELLKQSTAAILSGIISGVLTGIGSVFILSKLFGLSPAYFVTLMPKSVTTAIGMGISEEYGGYTTITVAAIVITGILGHIISEAVLKLFRITHPVAKGIAIGSASHAIGTAKAVSLGEIEGAMSSLSIALSGIFTVVFSSIFVHLY